MKPGKDPLTLPALQKRFSDPATCLAVLEKARWPDGPVCLGCGVVNHASRITTLPGRFTCLDCGKRFSVTAGTAMHSTHLPIATWIIAMYLIVSSSKGISALKLASLLGLQYRTTWHLTHRIRAMMDSDPALLKGIVELDETYMGGKPRASNNPQPPAPIPLFEEPKAEKPAKTDGPASAKPGVAPTSRWRSPPLRVAVSSGSVRSSRTEQETSGHWCMPRSIRPPSSRPTNCRHTLRSDASREATSRSIIQPASLSAPTNAPA